jgi:cysteine-rich repeat protein
MLSSALSMAGMRVHVRNIGFLSLWAGLVACGDEGTQLPSLDASADIAESDGGRDISVEDTELIDVSDAGFDVLDGGDARPEDANETTDTSPEVDVEADVERDVGRDVVQPDVGPSSCGDGEVQGAEECDDGNDVDDDACRNDCVAARCGDGILNAVLGTRNFESPSVTDPFGNEGNVCDDGASCPESSCEVGDDPYAPEHGICQALGFERALAVEWGNGAGVSNPVTLRAFNWDCVSYRCIGGRAPAVAPPCEPWEMLNRIECEGIVGEQCDLGVDNSNEPDACRPDTCVLPFCGDGIVDSDEECDDANNNNADGCSNNCLQPQCGDGIVQAGEQCDDGDDIDDNGCRDNCLVPRCGDSVVQALDETFVLTSPRITNPFGANGYVCDDGGSCEGRACDVLSNPSAPEHGMCQALGYQRAVRVAYTGGPGTDDPTLVRPFNWRCAGFVCSQGLNDFSGPGCASGGLLSTLTCRNSFAEQCDRGSDNANVPDSPCRTNCQTPFCGDGIVDTGEECDDGNRTTGDACTNACNIPFCGDGVVSVGEQCDDGNDVDTDRCRNSCVNPVCGDAVVSTGESCDAGVANSNEPDAPCRRDCTAVRCGDGVTDSGEACDDGNDSDRDLCLNRCAYATCGDGIRQFALGERCDDGNTANGDGCDQDCLPEAGSDVGRIVYIGHDYFVRSAATDRIVANAVNLSGAGSIRILGYTERADTSGSGEVTQVNNAINALSSVLGFTSEIVFLTRSGSLSEQLDDFDVLLVYEQEGSNGTQMRALGAEWADELDAFLGRGGTLVITDFSGESWNILVGASLLDIGGSVSVSGQVTVIDASHPVMTEVAATYPATSGTIALQPGPDFDGAVLATDSGGRAVVVYYER